MYRNINSASAIADGRSDDTRDPHPYRRYYQQTETAVSLPAVPQGESGGRIIFWFLSATGSDICSSEFILCGII